mgnify:CR=1 FL=1
MQSSQNKISTILPAPFAWMHIPAGTVTLIRDSAEKVAGYLEQNTVFDVPEFHMAKYLVTNAQYRVFVENGYMQSKWWTEEGWALREKGQWTQPSAWTLPDRSGDEYPVCGVSWYEAVAFCRWLSDASGEAVTLPTEPQWQRAAQGDDGRIFPWGNEWDSTRCSNNVDGNGTRRTNPVRQYEAQNGKPNGESPFGVLDMVGNLWEWCLTDYHTGQADIHQSAKYRILRGAPTGEECIDLYRCDYRYWFKPHERYKDWGIRLVKV